MSEADVEEDFEEIEEDVPVVKEKFKRIMTEEGKAKLAIARQKALEVRKANAAPNKKKQLLEAEKKLTAKMSKLELKKKEILPPTVKKLPPHEEELTDDEEPNVIIKKKPKKKKKKPIIIVQDDSSDSDSSDNGVIYIKKRSKKKVAKPSPIRERPLPQPIVLKQPPIVKQQQFFNSSYFATPKY